MGQEILKVYDEENVFIKIIRGDIKACKVYEDKTTLAIMDIMPQAPGHVLILPKDRSRNLLDAQEKTLLSIIIIVQKIALACQKAFQADGIKILQFNELEAGQTVFHLHFHVIPCKSTPLTLHHSDSFAERKLEDPSILELNAQKIQKELNNS
ncbi:Bis(5'-nucleosyl)-tetraphosphatase (asymmetrical) [Liberibacter crescens BT-1]|uniref:Bis(5'-nucleosyl)-tetraphosphatase (Asymmetrical) n=1 Tax=Liberibacter crescens (strain BT-1) TaxID=1215343 RepID=L0ESX6_LIBCB|nr:HIT domain-containing protein [Liberibacter crescens]AGA64032.1 Bis(5'-nucleosyl)-tetraphosphatase (asymmetrical) [Liberibacter crescens BT-1]AMC12339.1 HIT family hydrolase [Liberibacter crescens]